MRPVPASIDTAWNSGRFVGRQRNMVRITAGRWEMAEYSFGSQVFRSALFNQYELQYEVPNIQKFTWTKATSQAAGQFTLTLVNTQAYPPGVAAQMVASGQIPRTAQWQGSYAPILGGMQNKGSVSTTEDGYSRTLPSRSLSRSDNDFSTIWQTLLQPDMILKSFEGYGCTPDVAPEEDPLLVQTGVWMIDTVQFTADGTITVQGRDLGRLLVDAVSVYPVVPLAFYPLAFDAYEDIPAVTAQVPVEQSGTGTLTPGHSSNQVHNGDGPEYGHTLGMAFDGSRDTYWMSVGNAYPNADFCFEYVEGNMPSGTVSSVTVDTKFGPYTAYVSVYANGAWQGDSTVPYNPHDPNSGPNGADIRYVTSGSAAADGPTTFSFSPIDNATRVRVCLTNLQNFHIGPYPYRAGIRSLTASYSKDGDTKTVVVTPEQHIGNYGDFTDIVKLFCAWAGFYWPRDASSFYTLSDGTRVVEPPPTDDGYLQNGRVWGDFQETGTHNMPSNPLDASIWDHKTLADCVSYIQDMIGFNFFIGDLGGVVWRPPNWYLTGNYQELDSPQGHAADVSARTPLTVVIDERKTLISLQVTLSSQNIRERVAVSTADGRFGAVVQGFNPNPRGLTRIGVYSDQRFSSDQECQVMAELIALQEMFTYRTDQVVIPGYPRIQIDDQVIIKEQYTGEFYRHYVSQIQSSNDLMGAGWTYQLGTNWLGTDPVENWAFDFQLLSPLTQNYLATLGQAPAYGPANG